MDLESQSDLVMMMMIMVGVVKLVISSLFLSWNERFVQSLTPSLSPREWRERVGRPREVPAAL